MVLEMDFQAILEASELPLSGLTAILDDYEDARDTADLQDQVQNEWDDLDASLGTDAADVETLLSIAIQSEGYIVVKGVFDFGDIESELEDRDFEEDTYRDHRIWEHEYGQSVALFPEAGIYIYGGDDIVKDVIRSIVHGEGLMEGEASLRRAQGAAGDGLVRLAMDCDELDMHSPGSLSALVGRLDERCESVAVVVSGGDEDGTEAVIGYVYGSEGRAESALEDIEESIGDSDEIDADIDEIGVDGDTVTVRLTVYGSSSGSGMAAAAPAPAPAPAPTAAPATAPTASSAPPVRAESVSLRVSAGQSGTLEHDSGARMEIPQGALIESVTVSISEVEPPASPARVGRVYDFSVADTPILAPITLHIPFELQPGADSSGVVPLHWDEDLGVWEVLEGEVLESSSTVAVTVLDLSMFTVSGGDAPDGNQPSTIGLAAKPRIVKVEVPETVVVDEPFDVHWTVQNEGPLDLGNIGEGAVGRVRLLSPREIEGWRREAASGAPGIVNRLIPDWWLAGHSYSSREWGDEPFTITPSEVGPLTVRVELVFENGDGDLVGRDVVEREVRVTTHRSISAATVVVDGREYRVSGEADSRGVTEYTVEDAEDSSRVTGTLRDKAVFTAYVQQTYRTAGNRSYNRAFRRFERAIGFKEGWVVPSIGDLKFGVAVSTGIGFVIASPNLFAKAKAAANVTVDVLLKIIREFTDNAEKVTEEVTLKEREITLELLREKVEITTRVQNGEAMSFADALRLADGDTYSAIYFPPTDEARRMIVRRNSPSPEDALKTVAGDLAERITHLPVSSILKLDEALSALKELRQPLSLYEPWKVMTDGIQANTVAERAGHASFLNSLRISDHAPFQLPVLTEFTILDYSKAASSGVATTAPALTPESGRIAFASDRDGNFEIYVMNADGSGQTRLTHNDASDSFPRWSPDARRIMFASTRDGDWDIYVMNADGSGQMRLTHDEGDWEPSWSPDGRRIAFSSNRDGNREIYVMDADGSDITRLTDDPAKDWIPRWSPDGRRIMFGSNRDGKSEIYVMDADGSDVTQLTHNDASDSSPRWSPDGRRIVFESFRDNDWEIYVMNADGSRQTRLTDSPRHESAPNWSPDGRRIVFESYRDGKSEIYVMNADGSGVTRLTHNDEYDRLPRWSPDGRQIAFESVEEIFVMNADGSGLVQLTDNDAREGSLRWSPVGGSSAAASVHPSPTPTAAGTAPQNPLPGLAPGGGRIAFTSYRDGNNEIYVMNADGSGVTRLTESEGDDRDPSWSPDGRRIAFSSDRDGNPEIYVMNADGTGVTRLTESGGANEAPSWSPDGRRIAFSSAYGYMYVMNADGTGVTSLTDDNAGWDSWPSWSPDSRRIAFMSDRDGNPEIYVMNADGTGVTRLTDSPQYDYYPSWSPDGRRITFQSSGEIYVMNADGTAVTRLTDIIEVGDEDPSWSPDGRSIVFVSDRDGDDEIYVMNADGTAVTRLTTNDASDSDPSWSPESGLTAAEVRQIVKAAVDWAIEEAWNDRYLQLLGMVPDTPEMRSGVFINNYAMIRQVFDVRLSGPDDVEEDLARIWNEIRSGQRDVPLAVDYDVFLGPLHFSVHRGRNLEVNQNRRYLAFDYVNMDQSVVAGFPPHTTEAIAGRFDPLLTDEALSACSECPPPSREEHRGVRFYAWGESYLTNIKQGYKPPAFDGFGRGGRIAVLDSFVIRTLGTPDMESVIDATLNEVPSLADVQEFRVLTDSMHRLGAYSMVLGDDVAPFRLSTGHRQGLSEDMGPLLRPYEAFAMGAGLDSDGGYMALALLHSDGTSAENNVELLRRIIQNGRNYYEEQWKEIIDYNESEVYSEGRVLLAKLRGWVAANWSDVFRLRDSLIWSE